MNQTTFHRLLCVLVAIGSITGWPASAVARQKRQPPRKPVAWLVSVNHSIDLNRYARKTETLKPGAEVDVLGGGPRRVINLTSGIVIDTDGHIVTRLVNLDPADTTQDIKITTSTGKILPARLVGLDGPTGLAILRAPALRGSETAPMQSGMALQDGGDVVVVTPEYSLQRVDLPVARVALYPKLQPFPGTLDADVPPLLRRAGVTSLVDSGVITSSNDLSILETATGELFGVVKYVSPGRGHVLRLDFIRDVVAKRVVASQGSVAAGWLGADGVSLSELAPPNRPAGASGGVLIQRVSSNGPAETAGLKRFDLVVGFDEFAVQSAGELAVAINSTPAGTMVNLKVVREGQPLTLRPVLTGRPWTPGGPVAPAGRSGNDGQLLRMQLEQNRARLNRTRDAKERARLEREIKLLEDSLRQAGGDPAEAAPSVRLGLQVQRLTPQLASFFGVENGVLIAKVDSGSASERAGLKAGDVITRVAATTIHGENALDIALGDLARGQTEAVEMIIQRERKPVTVVLRGPAGSAPP